MTKKELINRDPDILGGTPVFAGTRVPIETLFDYLQDPDGFEEFLDGFPSVSREQALALLALAKEAVLAET